MSNFPVLSTPANATPADRSGTVNGTVQTAAIAAAGANYAVNDTITLPQSVVLKVTSVTGGAITGVSIQTPGNVPFANLPGNPAAQVSSSGAGTGAQFNLTWVGIATQLLAANVNRKSLEVFNPGNQTIWVNPIGTAAQATPGSFPIYPGGGWTPPMPYSGAISVYAGGAGAPVTIYEG